MKLLVRIMYFLLITLIVTFSILYLLNTNVVINELNECSSLAMKQTQNIMKDIVISRLDRNEESLFGELSYEEYYLNAFESSVQNKDLYDAAIDGDYDKGILFVEISAKKYPLARKKKLLNIVNVEGEGLNDIDSLYFEDVNSSKKIGLNTQKWNSTAAQNLYTWSFDKDTPITSFRVEVYGINDFTSASRTKYGPKTELQCTNEKGETRVLKSASGGKQKSSVLSGKVSASCKYVDLVTTEDVQPGTYSDKTDTIVVPATSYIEIVEIGKKEKENYKLSEHIDVYTRYIDDFDKLNSSSIFMQDKSYEETLKEFINKL